MRCFKLTVLTLALFFFFINPVYAGGVALTNKDVQVAQTETHAAIIFDGEKETLLDSFTFMVNPITVWEFAWLIAVPSKPDVTLVKDDLFPKLESLITKTVSRDSFLKKILYFDIEEEKYNPSDIFTRPIDFVRFDVLEPPEQMKKLDEWLSYSSLLIPKTGRRVIEKYQNKGWYFVIAEVNALHIQMQASESLTIPGVHTFPIMITFPTKEIVYPLKLTSIQPDYDTKDIPLGFTYGQSSENVLGEKDEKVDDELSSQSKNTYPQLPLDYMHIKSDLFVFASDKVTADGYTTVYSNSVSDSDAPFKDLTDQEYFHLPQKSMKLTRLVSYRPMSQLEDISIKKAANNTNVNAYSSKLGQYLKIFMISGLLIAVILAIKKFKEFTL